jgi:glycosyltransferase involved in cell wall biosynthesis
MLPAMTAKPFFSIVIPTYNRAQKLMCAIDSVLSQKFEDFELIIVDNGSTDGTKQKLLERYTDPRIVYHYQMGTGSPAGPRNKGIDLSKGNWISFLDSDDLWYPDKLACVKAVVDDDSTIEVVCHDEYKLISETGDKLPLHYGPYEKDFYRALLLGGNRLSTSATSIRRDFLNKHTLRFNDSAEYIVVEDYDLWLKLAQKGAKFEFITQPLGEFVIAGEGLSGDTKLKRNNVKKMLRAHVESLHLTSAEKRKVWERICFRMLMGDLKNTGPSSDVFYTLAQLGAITRQNPMCIFYYLNLYLRRKSSRLLLVRSLIKFLTQKCMVRKC